MKIVQQLKAMSYAELDLLARKLGIVGATLMSKDELVSRIEYAQEHPDEEIEITPKKRVTKLKLECLLKDEKYFITMNHKKIYYLTTEKIITNDDNFKLILDNGNIYDKEKIIIDNNKVSEEVSDIKKNDEVSDILNDDNIIVVADVVDNKIIDDQVV